MRMAIIDGTVTLSRCHPSLRGASLKLATPLSAEEISAGELPVAKHATGESLVVWDDLGAGARTIIALSEGGEAAQPFRPEKKPVDAYNAAILDHVEIDRRVMAE